MDIQSPNRHAIKFWKGSPEYQLMASQWAGREAIRSGVPYMAHVDEGITILSAIGADNISMGGYIVHGLFQNDSDFHNAIYRVGIASLAPASVAAAVEYRRVANSWLSKTPKPAKIEWGPLEDNLRDMLIADKVQNLKDFMQYHYGQHERSQELYTYFWGWLEELGVTRYDYDELAGMIE